MEYIPKGTRDFSVKLMDACIKLAHHRQALHAQRVMYKRHIIYIKMKNSFFVLDKNSKPKYWLLYKEVLTTQLNLNFNHVT